MEDRETARLAYYGRLLEEYARAKRDVFFSETKIREIGRTYAIASSLLNTRADSGQEYPSHCYAADLKLLDNDKLQIEAARHNTAIQILAEAREKLRNVGFGDIA